MSDKRAIRLLCLLESGHNVRKVASFDLLDVDPAGDLFDVDLFEVDLSEIELGGWCCGFERERWASHWERSRVVCCKNLFLLLFFLWAAVIRTAKPPSATRAAPHRSRNICCEMLDDGRRIETSRKCHCTLSSSLAIRS